jgi:hypothetical protein
LLSPSSGRTTSETSANFYQTTQCNNPEGSHLHTRVRENIKSHNPEDDHLHIRRRENQKSLKLSQDSRKQVEMCSINYALASSHLIYEIDNSSIT